MVKSLAFLWLFQTSQPPHSALTRQANRAEFGATAAPSAGFTVRFTVSLGPVTGERCVLDAPEVFRVNVRLHDPSDRGRQNYPAYRMPDGSVPVLEATLLLHSSEHLDWREMTVGFPLAMLPNPDGEHEVVLSFTGPRWTIYADGMLMDNDFPFGYPAWPTPASWSMDPEWVKEAALYVPPIAPKAKRVAAPGAPIQYWTPPGHNTWVGDVVTCFHEGRYHVSSISSIAATTRASSAVGRTTSNTSRPPTS
jgi:hypothetical protein